MPLRIKCLWKFEGHDEKVDAVAVLPDGRHMVSGSADRTLNLWDLMTGVVLKKMEGHYDEVKALAVSRDGRLIASGDESGDFIAWQGKTGESLTEPIKAHSQAISSLDFSPDGAVLATASASVVSKDGIKLWSTETWKVQGDPIHCWDIDPLDFISMKSRYLTTKFIHCIRYSPSGEHLAIATIADITIYNPRTRDCIANLKGHRGFNFSLAWMPDGTRLLSGGSYHDPNIREWDASTWQQVGDSWKDNTYMKCIHAIAINSAGTLAASLSLDNGYTVRLWRISDSRTSDAIWKGCPLRCITFSIDGKRILGGDDKRILEFAIQLLPMKNALVKDVSNKHASEVLCSIYCSFVFKSHLVQGYFTKGNSRQRDSSGMFTSLTVRLLFEHTTDFRYDHRSPQCIHIWGFSHCGTITHTGYRS
jgi:WD40 repeat protein